MAKANFWKDLTQAKTFIFLFLYTLFIRFPFFFRDYIDRDESSFILMGQSWVDGYLPYTELWDIKPPLTFFFFSVIIYLFGKSFIAIRLVGVLLVALSSFFTYKIANNFYEKRIAFVAAFISIILQSLFGSLQGVMSEHIAMAFFMPAIYLLTNKENPYYFLLSGILMGAVLMIKLNMAYAVLFLGIFLFVFYLRKKAYLNAVKNSTFFGLGILAVILITYLPYYISDLGLLWWNSVIEAPLNYAGARQYSLLKIMGYVFPFIFFIYWGWRKNWFNIKSRNILCLLFAIAGILLSFVKSGRVNGHYLILLHPVFVIFIGFAVQQIWSSSKRIKPMFWLVLLFIIPVESYLEYANIFKNKIEKGTYFNGEGIDVPKYIIQNNINTDNILFFEYHIGYWSLDKKPPTKAATQPSNILKDEMFFAYDNTRKTGMEELKYLMEGIRPPIVVTRKNRRVFDKKKTEANAYINTYLENNYQKLDSVDAALIYQRLE